MTGMAAEQCDTSLCELQLVVLNTAHHPAEAWHVHDCASDRLAGDIVLQAAVDMGPMANVLGLKAVCTCSNTLLWLDAAAQRTMRYPA